MLGLGAELTCPCAATPLHLPHLIGPMQHYLWILKTTHSGADMDTSMEMAKGSLDDGLRWTIYDILKNRQAHIPVNQYHALSSECAVYLSSYIHESRQIIIRLSVQGM